MRQKVNVLEFMPGSKSNDLSFAMKCDAYRIKVMIDEKFEWKDREDIGFCLFFCLAPKIKENFIKIWPF